MTNNFCISQAELSQVIYYNLTQSFSNPSPGFDSSVQHSNKIIGY